MINPGIDGNISIMNINKFHIICLGHSMIFYLECMYLILPGSLMHCLLTTPVLQGTSPYSMHHSMNHKPYPLPEIVVSKPIHDSAKMN